MLPLTKINATFAKLIVARFSCNVVCKKWNYILMNKLALETYRNIQTWPNDHRQLRSTKEL